MLAAAELKLLAALPPELRSRAGRIRERFHLDTPGWLREMERPAYLAAVADAVWNQRALGVRYRRWGGEVERRLEPLGVVLKGGVWYLVAQVAGQARAYRVSNILELETLEERFERPEVFDLTGFWQGWTEQFPARLYRSEATVRLSPRGLELVPYLFDPLVARAARASVGPPGADGWVTAVVPIESVKHGHHDLLRLGVEVEVLAPRELRERMAETAAGLMGMYGGTACSGTADAPAQGTGDSPSPRYRPGT